MHSPEWVEDRECWETDSAWYKRVLFRLIIDPVDRFYTWKYWKIDSKWHDVENAYMRVKHGVDWSDTWNMNNWFINGAVAILERWLEKGPMGSPCVDGETMECMSYEEWVGILNEMLEGFKLWQTYEGGGEFPEIEPQIYDSGTHHTSRCFISGQPEQSCYSEGAHYMTFDGVWHKCSMTHDEEKKYQRALDLFAKYHGTLWD